MKHLSVVVTGKVQGVFFRASAKQTAIGLGLTGWVKNEQDGSVQMEVEGDSAPLEQFIAWCHRGPGGAEVSGVKVSDGSLEHFSEFFIRR